ncbi:MAG: right-handed parallel beta-helix repeat-containing protein [Deltaproteobacteria bacterium]|nr:right-handed parallel beta-helix repeat-containing protein [Deltaproteobacteria bacterium]
MKRIPMLVGLVILCMALSAGPLYAVCSITRGKVEVSQGTGAACTSIQTAVNLANGTTPLLVSVLPGTYTENITMISNITLAGSGRDVTFIQPLSSSSAVVTISSLENVVVEGFTINGGSSQNGVQISSSSPTIKNNRFVGSNINAIHNTSASPIIAGNLFKDTGGTAILSEIGSAALVQDNKITNCGRSIRDWNSSSTLTGNVFEGNGDFIEIQRSSTKIINNIIKDQWAGIYVSQLASDGGRPIIRDNIITGSTGNSDINVYNGANPNISNNIYDTFTGSGAVGAYNVKQDGTPAPLQ